MLFTCAGVVLSGIRAMVSTPVFLVIHKVSHGYVASVINYIRAVIQDVTGVKVVERVAERIDEIDFPRSATVFVIGDPFPPFAKRKDCYYVFLNFSLLYNVTQWGSLNWKARIWIHKKHRRFIKKVCCYDMVLDFYKPQSVLMNHELKPMGVKVMAFLTNTREANPVTRPSLDDRRWDVCVVGNLSRRRRRIYQSLEGLGCNLSPLETDDLASVMRQSKVILNVHFHRCNTMEAPRIIQALNMGCCLVTETCYGLDQLVPGDCYRSVEYADIVQEVVGLLESPPRIVEIERLAKRYMEGEYREKCLASWKEVLDAIP